MTNQNQLAHETLTGFVSRLVSLARRAGEGDSDARASLARLRRALGPASAPAPEALQEVLPYLSRDLSQGVYTRVREICLLVGGLFALHPSHSGEHRNLGATLRALGDNPSAVQRFIQLLSARREQLPDLLRQAVSLAAAGEGAQPIDYYRFARDLLDWDREDRRVQLDWAREFWPPQPARASTESTGTPAPAGV